MTATIDETVFNAENIFGKGAPNTAFAQYFTGESFLNNLVADPECVVGVHNVTFVFPRGPLHWFIPMSEHYLPWLANHFPGVCWLQLPQEGPSGQESVSA